MAVVRRLPQCVSLSVPWFSCVLCRILDQPCHGNLLFHRALVLGLVSDRAPASLAARAHAFAHVPGIGCVLVPPRSRAPPHNTNACVHKLCSDACSLLLSHIPCVHGLNHRFAARIALGPHHVSASAVPSVQVSARACSCYCVFMIQVSVLVFVLAW